MNFPCKAGAMLVSIVVCTTEGICDTEFLGQVVEYRVGTEISDIEVKIMHAGVDDPDRTDEELGSATTDSDGRYAIQVPEDPESVNITYDTPGDRNWDPAGREYVRRVGPYFELDTIGLTNTQSGEDDEAEQRQTASNTAGYAAAGGDASVAQAAVRNAVKRFGQGYLAIAHQMGVNFVFKRRDIPFPHPFD